MNTTIVRHRLLVFSVSALFLYPLGADDISHQLENEKLPALFAKDRAANDKPSNQQREVNNGREATLYIPPPTENYAPELRTAKAGTRSLNNGYPVVSLLVPTHIALTVSAQPKLHWHITKSTKTPVVLTLVDPDSVEPLLEEKLQGTVSQGLHSLDLAARNIRLAIDKTYEWSVRLIDNPNDPSGDSVAKSFIERVAPNAEVLALADQNDSLLRAQIYAQNGIWYDLLASVLENVVSDQNALRHVRDSLLEQIALNEVVSSIRATEIRLGSNFPNR